ncbi:MAG: hypothetical protein RMN53_07465 [Anaerolineae bacterium]|nr:hypothetical protein [Caldilineales bacterium]MDW8317661.1 hypothetical protein [Anaerolineae bacterium]
MSRPTGPWLRRVGWGLGVLALMALYWLLPIRGQVIIAPGGEWEEPWPRWRISSANGGDGPATVQISDVVGWPYVLATVNGQPVPVQLLSDATPSVYAWAFVLPVSTDGEVVEVAFYHHCNTGCQRRSSIVLGSDGSERNATRLPQRAAAPTPLCAVEANPDRNWYGRSGWAVTLTYARLADQPHWGIDDLAWRVHQVTARGLRVLVRVDYDQGQSMPPAGDQQALALYLGYLRRLARDQRLTGVYGYVLGSGYNELSSNKLDPQRPVTPQWYARIFNGYGEPVDRDDNAIQIVRAENGQVRLLVGPVRPWVEDQDGDLPTATDAPWLNYMYTLVAMLDAGAQTKHAAGYALAAPDGFALHAPGRVGDLGALEPRTDQRRPEWNGAQAGFRVYRDWLDIINAFPTTRGLPVFITSTNTFVAAEGVAPADNYPAGWLSTALAEVRQAPQVQALCWFLDQDRSGDRRWDNFSLTLGRGRMADAAAEFDALLRTTP